MRTREKNKHHIPSVFRSIYLLNFKCHSIYVPAPFPGGMESGVTCMIGPQIFSHAAFNPPLRTTSRSLHKKWPPPDLTSPPASLKHRFYGHNSRLIQTTCVRCYVRYEAKKMIRGTTNRWSQAVPDFSMGIWEQVRGSFF